MELSRGHGRWLTQSSLVVLFGVLVGTLTMAFASLQIYNERARSLALWQQSAEAESGALAAHALQTLTAADVVLKSVVELINAADVTSVEGLRATLGTQAVHEMLKDRQSGVPQVSVASIVDLNGDMVNFTRNFPPRSNAGERINLKERDYFQAHLHNTWLDVFLSEPVENKGTGTWTFYIARKLRGANGSMLGVVLAGIETNYFQDFYKEIIAPGKSYALFHSNGASLARWPSADGVIGANYANAAVFRVLRSGLPSAVLEVGEPGVAKGTAEEMRIVAPTQVKNYPVAVVVRVSGELALASWRRSMISTITLAVGLTFVTALLTVAVLRLLRRNAQVIADLEAARQLSEVAARAKTDFLAVMSHEIRTPMNAVVGLVSLLSRTRMNEEQTQLLRVISDSADGLLAVVNDVLDFSRLDSGKHEMAHESYSVARLIDGVMAVARAYPGAERLALSSIIEPDVPAFLKGDRGALSRLLLNLMHNAVKFTAAGSVSLTCRLVLLESGERRVAFAVTDTGAGVPAVKQSKIFEPFEQASNGRLSPHHGTGLGLAICRRIAEAMGGEIGLKSAEGRGASFTCVLPVQIGERVEDADVSTAFRPRPTNSLRVLVAEDTPASQMVIRLMLEGMGHRARVVSDGEQAVRAFREEIFDLVFLDVQMPVMNGYEAAAAIRAAIDASRQAGDGAERTAKIIGLSAFAQSADRNAAIKAGMDDYLSKPIRVSDLRSVMARVDLGPLAVGAPNSEAEYGAIAGGDQSTNDAANVEAPQGLADLELMTEFFEIVGPAGFVEAISTFKRETPGVIAQLSDCVDKADDEGVRQIAHRLTGVFGQFGATDAAALAARIETLPKASLGEPVKRLIELAPGAIAMVGAASVRILGRDKAPA